MRSPGIAVLVGVTLWTETAIAGSEADAVDTWVATTHLHHAGCVHHALAGVPVAITLDGAVGVVAIAVEPRSCAAISARLLAYGVTHVQIDGSPHALLDLLDECAARRAVRPATTAAELTAFLHAEAWLWTTLDATVRADLDGDLDDAAASLLATRCADLAADVLALGAAVTLRQFTGADWVFTHGAWTGTVADLAHTWCPLVDAAADRIRTRRASDRGPDRRSPAPGP